MGDLLGLSIGSIFAVFQMWGMLLCCIVWLNMSVRILMACGPRCFKCKLEMPSGTVDLVFLAALIAAMVVCGVNCVGKAVSSVSL